MLIGGLERLRSWKEFSAKDPIELTQPRCFLALNIDHEPGRFVLKRAGLYSHRRLDKAKQKKRHLSEPPEENSIRSSLTAEQPAYGLTHGNVAEILNRRGLDFKQLSRPRAQRLVPGHPFRPDATYGQGAV